MTVLGGQVRNDYPLLAIPPFCEDALHNRGCDPWTCFCVCQRALYILCPLRGRTGRHAAANSLAQMQAFYADGQILETPFNRYRPKSVDENSGLGPTMRSGSSKVFGV